MNFILHIDIDAFFPSVEKILHPEYINMPLIIAANSVGSTVTSACYIAREHGIKVGMKIRDALKLCPNLVIQVSEMDVYKNFSTKFFYLIKQQLPGKIIIGSIDECYVLLDSSIKNHHAALDLAKKLQVTIFTKMQLRISIGISSNKFLAKMATNRGKPNGIFWIYPDEIKEKLWPLPIETFFGIGRQSIPYLKDLKIKTIADFATRKSNDVLLSNFFGIQYIDLWQKSNGFSNEFIKHKTKSRSIAASKVVTITTLDQAINLLRLLVHRAWTQLVSSNYVTIVLRLQIGRPRFILQNKEKTIRESHQFKLNSYTDDENFIFSFLKEKLQNNWSDGLVFKYLGITLGSLKEHGFQEKYNTISLFDFNQKQLEHDNNNSKINEILDIVNKKFHSKVVSIIKKNNDDK